MTNKNNKRPYREREEEYLSRIRHLRTLPLSAKEYQDKAIQIAKELKI